MPSDMTAADLAKSIASTNFFDCAVTVIGYGNMGRHYVKALHALKVKQPRVCSRSAGPLEELKDQQDIEIVQGGLENLRAPRREDECAIVAVPISLLFYATEKLIALGFRRLLIEKPISLWSAQIEKLAQLCDEKNVDAFCAYNRASYPSFHEAKSRAEREGGITSCTYTFTEMISSDWIDYFQPHELARWGIANSMHVISMAHQLIGFPSSWSGQRSGKISWHPSGAVFVGSGISEKGVPFVYHADWGSTGRWSLEIHTAAASYRLCPLERLSRRLSATADWVSVPLAIFAPEVKAGFAEQVAAMLNPDIRSKVSPINLYQAAALTKYAENLFGYESAKEEKLVLQG